MTTDKNHPIDLPILVIEAQIFVAVKKFQFLPNKLIPSVNVHYFEFYNSIDMNVECTNAQRVT